MMDICSEVVLFKISYLVSGKVYQNYNIIIITFGVRLELNSVSRIYFCIMSGEIPF